MKGFTGKILRVDLSSSTCVTKDLDEKIARDYLGGRGLGTRILYDEQEAGIEPFSAENILVFATGPLTGTKTPSSGRHFIVSKSPATGGITFTSSGGTWAVELKKAGYDAIVVKGKAEKPTYLWIEDGKVELRDAGMHWGKLVSETDDGIRDETHSEAKVLCIGPAGEKMSFTASIMNEKYRAAGRTGLGAVMGSKNLKAIAVKGEDKDKNNIEVADGIGLARAVDKAIKKLAGSDVTKENGGLNVYGTGLLTNVMNASGIYPTRNFQTGTFEDAGMISGETVAGTIFKESIACHDCPIECGKSVEVKSGKYAGAECENLQYETSWAFGGQCGVNDIGALTKANSLCNELGLDTISTGSTIGFAMELMDRGIISKDDVSLDLEFGNDEAMIEMTEMIGKREGFGEILADGTKVAAKKIGKGSDYYAMHVKGLEIPGYDPRGAFGLGLNYATANRGGCHVSGFTIASEIFGIPLKADPFDPSENMVDLTIMFQNLTASVDSSGNCLFLTFALGADDYADMIKYVAGWKDYSIEEFLTTGDRIFALERLFNKREGFDSKDDTLPERLRQETMPEGAPKGNVHPLEDMLDMYYNKRGYNKDGHPVDDRINALGLA